MRIKDLIIMNKLFGKKVIHVEAPHMFTNPLIEHLKKYNSTCYCITPTNYEYVKSTMGYNGSKEDFRKELKEIYLSLKKMGIYMQPHIHLSMFTKKLSNNYKEKKIKEAFYFFVNELDIVPTKVVFGWWNYDKFSEKLVEELGLTIVEKEFHIYDFWLK